MPWTTSPIPLPRLVGEASRGVETHKRLPPLPAILEIINRRGGSASASPHIGERYPSGPGWLAVGPENARNPAKKLSPCATLLRGSPAFGRRHGMLTCLGFRNSVASCIESHPLGNDHTAFKAASKRLPGSVPLPRTWPRRSPDRGAAA
jgi:hypothetical protein